MEGLAAIASRYAAVRARVDAELGSLGREPASATILVVTKQQSAQAIAAAIAAGASAIGENYLQEAQAKFAHLPPVRKHFIGHVQSNKATGIVRAFDVVQAVDRLNLVAALDRAALALETRTEVLIQVNISPMERFGCTPDEALALAEAIRQAQGLRLGGLMAIAPHTADRARILAAFEGAAALHRQIGGATLSLGMSGDWREALRAGSTMLRLGTAIFGARLPA